MSSELEATVEEESRNQWKQRNETAENDMITGEQAGTNDDNAFTPMVDFEEENNNE